MKRWLKRPEGSNWGDFGEDDQVGRLNFITPERRLEAVQEVRSGLVFPLSLPLNLPKAGMWPPRKGQPPRLQWTSGPDATLYDAFGAPGLKGAIDLGNDDCAALNLQYSTQWDSLAHIGALFDADGDGVPEKRYYNGYRSEQDLHGTEGAAGVRVLGIENMATTCVQGRGVLVNLFKAFGRKKTRVDYELLMSVLDAQRAVVEPGDILCLYTGYGDAVMDMDSDPATMKGIESSFSALDGNDARLLQWITDSGIAAICADNGAVEAKPEGVADGSAHCEPGATFLPLHHHCIFKLGMHLGELWYFRELAVWLEAAGRSRFLLTAPPLRLPGAVGCPPMPVATV
ncbi:MAG: cyclase family protein [Gammaproteobacteria bacterium]|nr:MAG: cyclase family protein [Gammaproteobacteria bacterium]